jgi:hypothetical protein
MAAAVLLTKQFHELVNTAVTASSSRSWRQSVECYKAAFELKPNNEDISYYKYHALCGFCNILIEGQIPPQKADYKFLKTVAEDPKGEYPPLVRVKAHFTIGFCRWANNERQLAILTYKEAIKIGYVATDSEKSVGVMFRDPALGMKLTKVDILLQSVMDSAQNNLDALQGKCTVSDQMSAVIEEARLSNRYKLESAKMIITACTTKLSKPTIHDTSTY